MPKEAFETYISKIFLFISTPGANHILCLYAVGPFSYLLFSFRGLTNQLEGKITGAKAGKTKLDTHRLNLCKSEVVSYIVFYCTEISIHELKLFELTF